MSNESWHFDPDNEGNSFHNGYGLLDEHGHPVGIFIETGGVFNDAEQWEKAFRVSAVNELLNSLIELEAELCFRFSAYPDRAPGYMAAELRRKVLGARAAIKKARGLPTAEDALERIRNGREGQDKGDGIKT